VPVPAVVGRLYAFAAASRRNRAWLVAEAARRAEAQQKQMQPK
jgi:hypothetical protein